MTVERTSVLRAGKPVAAVTVVLENSTTAENESRSAASMGSSKHGLSTMSIGAM